MNIFGFSSYKFLFKLMLQPSLPEVPKHFVLQAMTSIERTDFGRKEDEDAEPVVEEQKSD